MEAEAEADEGDEEDEEEEDEEEDAQVPDAMDDAEVCACDEAKEEKEQWKSNSSEDCTFCGEGWGGRAAPLHITERKLSRWGLAVEEGLACCLLAASAGLLDKPSPLWNDIGTETKLRLLVPFCPGGHARGAVNMLPNVYRHRI
jgi:hypothetical protein